MQSTVGAGRPPGPEMENCIDRESYSLAAGLSLGLVMFGVSVVVCFLLPSASSRLCVKEEFTRVARFVDEDRFGFCILEYMKDFFFPQH